MTKEDNKESKVQERHWEVSSIGSLAYEYCGDKPKPTPYSEFSLKKLLKSGELNDEDTEWYKEGLSLLKEAQFMIDRALENLKTT